MLGKSGRVTLYPREFKAAIEPALRLSRPARDDARLITDVLQHAEERSRFPPAASQRFCVVPVPARFVSFQMRVRGREYRRMLFFLRHLAACDQVAHHVIRLDARAIF